MKRTAILILALIFSAPLFSQRDAENDYWNSWRYTVKEGMDKDFRKAVAKKMALYNNTPDKTIFTFQVVTGRNSGTYERVEPMKYPKDYDLDRSGEADYWQENVGKYVTKSSGQMRWDRINNATINWDPENPGTPSKYLERTTYDVRPGRILDFRRFVYRVTETRKKRGFKDTQLMFRCISGGSDNMFVVVQGYNSHQDRPMPENDKSFEDDYNDQFGWGTFDEDRQRFDDSLEDWGEYTETLVLVPSLTTGMMN